MSLLSCAKRLVADQRILDVLEKIPRREFLPPNMADSADIDDALPIGEGQTTSQPSLVAYMIGLLELKATDRVLEVGTGCGYQTAFLAELAGAVFTVERIEALGTRAKEILEGRGWRNIRFRIGNGGMGWPEGAPFDAIIVSCAAESVPAPLIDQMKMGGRLVIPLGRAADSFIDPEQELWLIRKTASGLEEERKLAVRFVPMRS
ncbi:MAG: protein-L-isoaspartate(D-aspartate) O-methyltransferase [Elusimicrobia bacterium]|nr:protein-L-isoaspartate(D-aspartate) O-methyltransferase [Elusimicrobiota bacterium]